MGVKNGSRDGRQKFLSFNDEDIPARMGGNHPIKGMRDLLRGTKWKKIRVGAALNGPLDGI